MQITNEMVEAGWRCGYGPDTDLSKYQQAPETKEAWRIALEAALGGCVMGEGSFKNITILLRHKADLDYGNQALLDRVAACIEDLAGALKEISSLADVDADNRSTIVRSVLERWGLK